MFFPAFSPSLVSNPVFMTFAPASNRFYTFRIVTFCLALELSSSSVSKSSDAKICQISLFHSVYRLDSVDWFSCKYLEQIV